eukprot:gene22422-26612_t
MMASKCLPSSASIWQLAVVLYGNGVGERKAVLLGLRLFRQKAGDDADVDLITRIGHARGLKSK